MPQYDLDVTLLEAAGRLLADLMRLETVLGSGAARRALGLEEESEEPNISLRDIDPTKYPIGQVIESMHTYAYHQRLPAGMRLDNLKASVDEVEDFAVYLSSEILSMFMADSIHMGAANQAGWAALPELCEDTIARLDLDMGDPLSLDRLARLAGMTERSVRNALSDQGDARLVTDANLESEHLIVSNDEARRWLKGRRNFKPTIFEAMSAMPGEHPDRIESLRELAGYIDSRWHALGKTPDEIVRDLGWSSSRAAYLHAIRLNARSIDPADCADLARSLLVDNTWFTAQVMRNLFPEQIELLLNNAASQRRDPHPPPKQEDERMCTRVVFTLHDGTQLLPIRMKSRASGNLAFRVSNGGAGGNLMENTLEIENEDEMIDLVCKQNKAVRLRSLDGNRHGMYRKDGRSVRGVTIDGEPT